MQRTLVSLCTVVFCPRSLCRGTTRYSWVLNPPGFCESSVSILNPVETTEVQVKKIYWSIVDLQCLISVVRQSDSVIHILFQYGLSQDIDYSSLCYTVGPCCLSILYIIVCILFLLFSLSVVSDSVTPWTVACQASLSFIISQSLLTLMSVEAVMASNHLILCRPLLLPSMFPSIRVFPS